MGLGFYLFNEVTVSIGQLYQWPAFATAAGPTVAVALLAIWRLSRAR